MAVAGGDVPGLRNLKDSLKSTWRNDKSQWGIEHWILEILNMHPTDPRKPIPRHAKTEKMPVVDPWSANLFVIVHAAWPMVLQQLYIWYTGKNLHPVAAFLLYMTAYQFNAVNEINIIQRLGHQYGFLDGDKHERDQIPDVGVAKAFWALIGITSIRPLYHIFIAYRVDQPPTLSWWIPVELALYAVILDLFFYIYHRSCHELDALWKYHRTHHLTKHPNTMLSSYADTEQELIEMVVVPLLTYGTLKLMGFPMGFYDCWVCLEFLLFAEAFGHSGVRVHILPPGTSAWLLQLFDCELVTEDHDLHHRKGWRQSHNYGKQTRLWDKLFGTCHDRIESAKGNIDYSTSVRFPMF